MAGDQVRYTKHIAMSLLLLGWLILAAFNIKLQTPVRSFQVRKGQRRIGTCKIHRT